MPSSRRIISAESPAPSQAVDVDENRGCIRAHADTFGPEHNRVDDIDVVEAEDEEITGRRHVG